MRKKPCSNSCCCKPDNPNPESSILSIKDSFNEDEWFLLGAMPGLVGTAMSQAAPSGIIGTIKKMSVVMRASAQARYEHPESELISALISKTQNWDEAKAGGIPGLGGECISPPERELLHRIEATLGIESGLLLAWDSAGNAA